MPGIVERMLLGRLEHVDAVAGELLGRERDRARHRLAGVGILLGALALAVLDVDDLVLRPQLLELAQDAAVVAGIAVAVVLSLPRDDGGEMRRGPGGGGAMVQARG